VLVRSVDARDAPCSANELRIIWDALYPGEVYDIRVVSDTGQLPGLLSKLDHALDHLAMLEEQAVEAEAAAATKKLSKVEKAIAKQTQKVEGLRAKVATERDQHTSGEGVSYFVLFKSTRAATIAKQVINMPNAHFKVQAAPPPKAVRWASLKPAFERPRLLYTLASNALYYSALFFFVIPIGFVSSLMELQYLSERLPFIEHLLALCNESTRAAIAAFLPTVALVVFMSLLPYLCGFCSSLEGHDSVGQMHGNALIKLFKFKFIWSFFGLSIGSSLLNSLGSILESPKAIFTMLAGGLANASSTFMCLLLLYTCFTLPIFYLARPLPILMAKVMSWIGCIRPHEVPKEHAVEVYPLIWSDLMFVLTIGLCYASIAPLTIIFALAYVFVALAIHKKNLLYIYAHDWDSRGSFVPIGSWMVLLILGAAQVLLAAVHLTKGAFITFVFLLPLIVLTIFVHFYICRNYEPQMVILPLAEKDLRCLVGRPALPLRTAATKSAVKLRIADQLLHRNTDDALDRIFASSFRQPELLHEEVTNPRLCRKGDCSLPPDSTPVNESCCAIICPCMHRAEQEDGAPEEHRRTSSKSSRASQAASWLHEAVAIDDPLAAIGPDATPRMQYNVAHSRASSDTDDLESGIGGSR